METVKRCPVQLGSYCNQAINVKRHPLNRSEACVYSVQMSRSNVRARSCVHTTKEIEGEPFAPVVTIYMAKRSLETGTSCLLEANVSR